MSMPPSEIRRAPLHLADELSRDLVSAFGLALVRVWLLEPADPRTGALVLAAVNAAQPAVSYGGMLETHVLGTLRAAALGTLVLPEPQRDDRFAGTLPAGGFTGVPLLAGDLRLGYVEAYAESPLSLAEAGQIEAKIAAMGEIFDSARATAAAESPERGHILIADDDPGIRTLVKTLLERRGFEVTDVANGLFALEACRRVKPDLLLIDWVMPIMDGREATASLKADAATRDIPIVMLTSQSRIEDKVAALEAGAQDFLTKPFNSRELVARIEQQMRWRKLLADDTAAEPAAQTSAQAPAVAAPPPPPAPVPTPESEALDPALFTGDVWTKAVEAQQLGKHREALALYMHEAERCEESKQYPRAAIAYRSASIASGYVQNPDLSNKLLRLAGKMYLCWSETTQDARAIQEGYLNAARCFLSAGNLKLAKKSVDFAHSFESVISDNRPSSLA